MMDENRTIAETTETSPLDDETVTEIKKIIESESKRLRRDSENKNEYTQFSSTNSMPDRVRDIEDKRNPFVPVVEVAPAGDLEDVKRALNILIRQFNKSGTNR